MPGPKRKLSQHVQGAKALPASRPPGEGFSEGEGLQRNLSRKEFGMSYTSLGAVLVLSMVLSTRIALGFCGFYVAKADTQLFNKASKVALVRHDGKTVMTMANDYRGDPQEFALVVPYLPFWNATRFTWVNGPCLITSTPIRPRGWWSILTRIPAAHALFPPPWLRQAAPSKHQQAQQTKASG